MTTLFLACAALGGGLLVVQLVLSLLGFGGEAPHDLHLHEMPDLSDEATGSRHAGQLDGGLNLLSLRAIAAGIAFFGVGGLAGLSTVGGVWVALPLGAVVGLAAAVAVAAAMRAMLRFADDGVGRIESAVGISGRVHLSVPAARGGAGKVHVPVQGRLVEYQAITSNPEPLPTGARILVVDVVAPHVVDVVPDPLISPSEIPYVVR